MKKIENFKMKNNIIFAALLFGAFSLSSCNKEKNDAVQTDMKIDEDSLTTAPIATGEDSASAVSGTFSAVKNGYVSLEEEAIILNSMADGSTEKAYLLFNADQSKAEVFLPNTTVGLMMDRKGTEGDYTWTDGEYELIIWKGYVLQTLKQGNKLFAGDVKM